MDTLINYPIYILSLKDDIDRRHRISLDLNSAGLMYEFVDAPDGRNQKIKKSEYSDLTNIEAACAKGHLEIYKKLLASDKNMAIILEDDISFSKENLLYFKNVLSFLEGRENFVTILGGQEGLNCRFYVLGKKIKIDNDFYIFESFMSDDYLQRACCYILSRDVAKKIVDLNEDLLYVADAWKIFKNMKSFNDFYYCKPAIFKHPIELSGSHLESERIKWGRNGNLSLIKRFFSVLKRVFNLVSRKMILCFSS